MTEAAVRSGPLLAAASEQVVGRTRASFAALSDTPGELYARALVLYHSESSQHRAQAASLFRRLSQSSDDGTVASLAAAKYGRCLEGGIGCARDEGAAVRYYRTSARNGCPLGIVYLGAALGAGLGGHHDEAAARQCFALAEQTDDAEALTRLAECYRVGVGVEQDARTYVRMLERAVVCAACTRVQRGEHGATRAAAQLACAHTAEAIVRLATCFAEVRRACGALAGADAIAQGDGVAVDRTRAASLLGRVLGAERALIDLSMSAPTRRRYLRVLAALHEAAPNNASAGADRTAELPSSDSDKHPMLTMLLRAASTVDGNEPASIASTTATASKAGAIADARASPAPGSASGAVQRMPTALKQLTPAQVAQRANVQAAAASPSADTKKLAGAARTPLTVAVERKPDAVATPTAPPGGPSRTGSRSSVLSAKTSGARHSALAGAPISVAVPSPGAAASQSPVSTPVLSPAGAAVPSLAPRRAEPVSVAAERAQSKLRRMSASSTGRMPPAPTVASAPATSSSLLLTERRPSAAVVSGVVRVAHAAVGEPTASDPSVDAAGEIPSQFLLFMREVVRDMQASADALRRDATELRRVSATVRDRLVHSYEQRLADMQHARAELSTTTEHLRSSLALASTDAAQWKERAALHETRVRELNAQVADAQEQLHACHTSLADQRAEIDDLLQQCSVAELALRYSVCENLGVAPESVPELLALPSAGSAASAESNGGGRAADAMEAPASLPPATPVVTFAPLSTPTAEESRSRRLSTAPRTPLQRVLHSAFGTDMGLEGPSANALLALVLCSLLVIALFSMFGGTAILRAVLP